MARKRLKELTDADIAACEPESIWLETRQCPLPAHVVLWCVLLMLVGALAWACLSKVDKVVTAEGRLVTTRPNITLKPYERSVVRDICVSPGQVVQEGEVLMTFDTTVSEAELRSLKALHEMSVCLRLRLLAEKEGAEQPLFPEDLRASEAARVQLQSFEARRSYYTERMKRYEETLQRYRATTQTMRASFLKYEELMQPMKTIEEMYTRLSAEGIAARSDMLQVQMQRMGNEIEMENQRARLVESERMERETCAEREVFMREWHKDIADRLEETEQTLIELERRISQAAYLASIECLRSPCRAVVHEIAPFQQGSGVREAESLLTLIPLDATLEAEVDILPGEVGHVRRGDLARIKMDAFPFQQYGTLQGRIRTLSADTYESHSNLTEQDDNPAAASAKSAQYRARLVLSGDLQGVPRELWSVSGMKLRAEIKVGERRVITYMLNPFLKALDESVREP